MARYTGPRTRLSRRFGIPMFGPDKYLERRNYGPGVHGPKSRRKHTEYGLGLIEKQKLRYFYGLMERQFRGVYDRALKRRGVTGEQMLQILETRLDNVVFHLGFANTRAAARQMVGHGHVTVNGRKMSIPSYSLKVNDVVSVKNNNVSKQLATKNLESAASRAVPDTIRAAGGVPLVNRVGHAFFKQRMRREPVLFGGEVSGHYYFQANHNADSGFIPALLILELLSRKHATMAELLAPLRSTYFISGEINSRVDDVPATLARIEQRFADGAIEHLDGVSVDYPDWHFNVRASNTEPLLRLNLGATGEALMAEKRDLVLSVIEGSAR